MASAGWAALMSPQMDRLSVWYLFISKRNSFPINSSTEALLRSCAAPFHRATLLSPGMSAASEQQQQFQPRVESCLQRNVPPKTIQVCRIWLVSSSFTSVAFSASEVILINFLPPTKHSTRWQLLLCCCRRIIILIITIFDANKLWTVTLAGGPSSSVRSSIHPHQKYQNVIISWHTLLKRGSGWIPHS